MWIWLFACSSPPQNDPQPTAPVIPVRAPPAVTWPELPALSPRSSLPPLDPKVEAIFEGAARFTPRQFMDAMGKTQAIGAPAVPSLLHLIDRTDEASVLFDLCEALQRLDVRDERVAPWVAPKLLHPDAIAAGPCTEALANSLPLGSPDLSFLTHLYDDAGHTPAKIRSSIAKSLREPSWCDRWEKSTKSSSRAERSNGIAGLARCDHSGPILLGIARDEAIPGAQRDEALLSLRTRPPLPAGRDTYLARVATQEPGHGQTSALFLLAEVAISTDRPSIQRVIDEDAYDGAGVHAVEARKTLRRMKQRGQ